MFWMLLFGFLLISLVMIVIYKYDDSLFSKATSYSIFEVLSNSRVRSLYKLTEELKATQEKYDILFDVQLVPNEQPVDAIIMHSTGVYIVNVEQKKVGLLDANRILNGHSYYIREKGIFPKSNPSNAALYLSIT